MAHLATCPQCDHEMFVPDGAEDARVRCPSCQASFAASEAKSRELPTVEVVETSSHDADDIDFAAREIAPISPADELALPTSGIAHEGETHDELESADEWLPVAFDKTKNTHREPADELELSSSNAEAELSFDDLHVMLGDADTSPSTPQPPVAPQSNAAAEDDGALDLDFDEPKPAAAPVETPIETPEAAAQRIDAWFKSAKTLADVPALGDVPAPEDPHVEYSAQHPPQTPAPISSAAANATVDFGSENLDTLHMNEDFELDSQSADDPQHLPAWDNSQHMDELLADLGEKPHDELELAEPVAATGAADAEEPHAENSMAKHAAAWTPDEAVSVTPNGGKPRRQKSFVRTFAMTTIGGVMGLALGYYVLLWIGGPQADYLNWSSTLPKAILPSSFGKTSRLMVSGPIKPTMPVPSEPAANEPEPNADAVAKTDEEPAKSADEATKPANEGVKTAAATTSTDSAPAEKQAAFTEPAAATNPPEGDRYAVTTNKPAEPATLDTPPAEPMKAAPAAAPEPIRITGAPTFSAADLTAAIAAGKGAEAGLVTGNLTDNRDVARTKGLSYSILADLAQKTTFVDRAAADAAQLQQEADAVYRETLTTPHAREEVAQILPKWMASPNRKHAGVFFAGSVVGHEAKGSVTECNVDLGNGQSLPVIMSAATADSLQGSVAPVAVIGWIVNKPAENVPGYTGTAAQAIYAARVVPLQ